MSRKSKNLKKEIDIFNQPNMQSPMNTAWIPSTASMGDANMIPNDSDKLYSPYHLPGFLSPPHLHHLSPPYN